MPPVIRVPVRQPPIEPGETSKTGRTVVRSYEPPPYVTMEKTRESVRSIRNIDAPSGFEPIGTSQRPMSAPVYNPPSAPVVRTGIKP